MNKSDEVLKLSFEIRLRWWEFVNEPPLFLASLDSDKIIGKESNKAIF